MPSLYLLEDEYAAFGVGTATTAQVQQATAAVNAYLRRPEGLVWRPDFSGRPCYMENAERQLILTTLAPLLNGENVSVQVSGPAGSLAQGDVLIINRDNEAVTEAVTVKSVDGDIVTLAACERDHAAGALMESGLVIEEERRTRVENNEVLLAQTPVMRVIAAMGRNATINRNTQAYFNEMATELSAIYSQLGPPSWQLLDVRNVDISAQVGAVWLPHGLIPMPFEDVRLRYVAGFARHALPWAVKQATAEAVVYFQSAQGIAGSIQTLSAGGVRITRFENTIFGQDTQNALASYRARLMG